MAENIQIASLEGGELKLPPSIGKTREIVLALPLNRLLVKVVRVPNESSDQAVEIATPLMKAMSPYPDEPLTVSCETVCETDAGRVVLAAALPESSADDVATALDESKLNVTRIDALALGVIPALLPQIVEGDESARRLVLSKDADCLSVFVFDGSVLVAIRAISPDSDLMRELMLSLVSAEEFNGDVPLKEIVIVGEADPGVDLTSLAPIRMLAPSQDPLEGIASRTLDPEAINALPESWREVLEETRFKSKMKRGFGIAGSIWLLALAVLVGVPKIYGYKTDHLNDRKEQRRQFNQVNGKKIQAEAVAAISNHDKGALETLRAVVTSMPEAELELSRWNFKRDERLTFSGTLSSGDQKPILQFKDALSAFRLSEISENEDDAETPFFADVSLPKGINTRSGRAATFDVECSFRPIEEAE